VFQIAYKVHLFAFNIVNYLDQFNVKLSMSFLIGVLFVMAGFMICAVSAWWCGKMFNKKTY